MKQEDKKIKMEDFVSFEIAKKLKEKGFREKCIATYDIEDGEFDFNSYILTVAYRMNLSVKDCVRLFNNTTNTGLIDAPTISQVLKWLRDEKKIYIEPCILTDADTDADGEIINEYTYWNFAITNIATGDLMYFEKYEHIDDKRFDSYEQAVLAGILYVLDNLI